jgi:alpha-amylase/alpha-mannosidase (GH57 family)
MPRAKAPVPQPAPTLPSGPQRYLCVHGHYYQPPRENPWLETVEVQDSAAPFHDWNERITSECYAPNGASRIVNKSGEIIRIVNNYARMSFNFGPTLLSWLHDFAPRTYRMIQDADKASAARYSGHGSALAQVYNHIILPLANERDARTQIRWGIADFEHRFGRRPEGMWLAETAVNRATLDLLAQEGILFTVLAPHQCARVRRLNPDAMRGTPTSSSKKNSAETLPFVTTAVDAPAWNPIWSETTNATVDPTQPYCVLLDEGRSIAVFFYDGPGSRAIAFEGLLNDGETFARRLLGGLQSDKPDTEPQLAHVATDGESYGHHHKHGEMALSYALHYIEQNNLAKLTNYGEYLSRFPPTWEAEVVDNSSWSCAHGVERWRSDCGCNGGRAGWNQQWRGPLREAFDLLRDRTAPLAETVAAPLLKNLWAARDAYIHVILDRSPESIDRFLSAHATHTLTPAERITVFSLLELERHTQLMYTSCGWFFDDISGIETVQIIAYAGRVLQLAAQLFGAEGTALEPAFLELLARAKSNAPDIADGAEVYRRFVSGARLDLENVGAHYAISSIFRNYSDNNSTADSGQIFCFDVMRHSYDILTSGRGRFAFGLATLRSRITEETEEIAFAVLHLGDQNLSAAVKRFEATTTPGAPFGVPDGRSLSDGVTYIDSETWEKFTADARAAVRRADLPALIRLIDAAFGNTLYSLTSLFSDEQQRILKTILDQTLAQVEGALMRIYEEHATLLDYLGESNIPAPPALAVTAGFALNAGIRRALESDSFDSAELTRLLRRAELDHIQLDTPLLSFTADKRMKRAMVRLESAGASDALLVLTETLELAEALRLLPMEINLWQAQNIWNDILQHTSATRPNRPWRENFRRLGLALNIAVDDLVTEPGVPTF